MRGSDDGPGHRQYFQPTDGTQHPLDSRVPCAKAMTRERRGDQARLAVASGWIKAGAAAGQAIRAGRQQRGGDRGGCRGVADPHFAKNQEIGGRCARHGGR